MSLRHPTDRRDFLRSGSLSLAAMWMAACNSNGPKEAAKLLKYAEQKNESLEMWLVRHTAMDHGSPGATVANDMFPSYFVSSSVPVWDPAMLGVWRLEVGGLVQRPMSFTLDELMQLPRHSQRVNHFCVEGWNAVAEFAGVRLSDIAAVVRPDPQAKCVDFQSFDSAYHESWDIDSVMHPQTMVVYAKDNELLSPAYGAPARVHSPIKLGYKNTKYLTRIEFMPERNGGYWTDRGYEWFGGT